MTQNPDEGISEKDKSEKATEKLILQHPFTTQKKTWKNYFFEFFMLFLAVTLGFYAENLREDLKNKEEVKVSMKSLLSDLKEDVILYDSTLDRNRYSTDMADSLIMQLHDDISKTPEIYWYARSVTANIAYFYSNTKTFDQLKNSGFFKLIKLINLRDSIGTYYVSNQWLAQQDDLIRLKIDEIHKGNAELFDSYVFYQMTKDRFVTKFYSKHLILNKPKSHPALLSTEFNKTNTVSLNYHYYSSTAKFYYTSALSRKKLAHRLIEMITKEYE